MHQEGELITARRGRHIIKERERREGKDNEDYFDWS